MYKRQISERLQTLSKKYRVVSLTGARQSGKTTLIRLIFPEHRYFSLENPSIAEVAREDPVGFLSQNNYRLILDEVQNAPDLFSYIQGIVDDQPEASFILSGSQNFLLVESISQSLAGRVAVLFLHPFTWSELSQGDNLTSDYTPLIWRGGYPALYDQDLQPEQFYPYYINTYLERDVRTLRSPSNLGDFQRFMRMVAGRAGHIINYADLARDIGVNPKTAKAWLYVLEQSHLIFLLQPYYKNFSKRLIKSPKLYFIDTGLLCYLLNIQSSDQLLTHFAQGAIFENAIVAEWFKTKHHLQFPYDIYYWRDNHGQEIDLLVETGSRLVPIEIKSSKTINRDFMKPVRWMQELMRNEEGFVIYGGDELLELPSYHFVPWHTLSSPSFFTKF